MKSAIITGASGMIGRALIDYLIKNDVSVLAIVRDKEYNDFPISDKFEIVKCNLEDLKSLELDKQYDVLYHFAWAGTYGESRNQVYDQIQNVKYTLDAVELAKRSGCKTFIGSGSQAEYGRVDGIITPDSNTNPENGYGIAKLCAGQMSRILANKYGIKHIWTRILSVYGPFDKEHTMVMSSIKSMVDNNESLEYTKGEQIWDYIYSKDVAKAFYLLGNKGKDNQVYLIASGKTKHLYEYIEDIKDNINPDIKLKLGYKDYPDKQVMNLTADISGLKNDTGFEPDYSFDEGIKETIEWYKKVK